MTHNPEVSADAQTPPVMIKLGKLTLEAPWYSRALRRIFPRRARYERAVRDSMVALLSELGQERRARGEDSANFDSRIRAAVERSDALSRQLENLEMLTRGLGNGLRACETSVDELRRSFSDRIREHDLQFQRFVQLAEQNSLDHASFDRALAELGKSAAWLESRLSEASKAVAASTGELRSEISALSSRAASDFAACSNAVAELGRRAAWLESRLSEASKAVASSTGELRAEISALSSRAGSDFAACNNAVAELGKNTALLESRLSEASKAVASSAGELRSQISALSSRAGSDFTACYNAVAELGKSAAGLESRLSEASKAVAASTSELRSEISALSSRVKAVSNGFPSFESEQAAEAFERFYLAFEDRYRGGRTEITHRQKVYLPYLAKCKALKSLPRNEVRIIDLGCGRGEWLELLRGEGYAEAVGVDINLRMAELCRGLKLAVEHCDGIDYLCRQADHSIGVITAMHLIEHLPFTMVLKLFREARRTLISGGLLILETPNCTNVLTATQNFPSDPTHRLPIPPILLSFAAENAGFMEPGILPLHPYDPEYQVDSSTPIGKRFNEFFFGPQDYALIARNA
jgi:SAM-dependent methyltransferase